MKYFLWQQDSSRRAANPIPMPTRCKPLDRHRSGINQAQSGYLANALTPFVGDANSQTPEFKAFLVNIEKA